MDRDSLDGHSRPAEAVQSVSRYQYSALALLGLIAIAATISASFDIWGAWRVHQLMSVWSEPFGMSMPPPTPIAPPAGMVMCIT